MPENVLLTLSDATTRKGTRRQTILAALKRGELNGIEGAAGWAGVYDDGLLESYTPAPPGRPKRATPTATAKPSRRSAAEAPSSPSKPRTRRKATDTAPNPSEPSQGDGAADA